MMGGTFCSTHCVAVSAHGFLDWRRFDIDRRYPWRGTATACNISSTRKEASILRFVYCLNWLRSGCCTGQSLGPNITSSCCAISWVSSGVTGGDAV